MLAQRDQIAVVGGRAVRTETAVIATQDGILAKEEQTAIIDGVAVKKETAILATEEGILHLEFTTVASQPQRSYLPGAQQPAIRYEPEPEGCCEDCYCCRCDGRHKWYSCKGKGPCVVMLLVLMYIILFSIGLPLAICLCICWICFCPNDD